MEKKKGFFMNIKDKFYISKTRHCPPHYYPHKSPIGKKICDEKCHIHKTKWNMSHHSFFCKYLKCDNYKFMINKNKEILKKNNY